MAKGRYAWCFSHGSCAQIGQNISSCMGSPYTRRYGLELGRANMLYGTADILHLNAPTGPPARAPRCTELKASARGLSAFWGFYRPSDQSERSHLERNIVIHAIGGACAVLLWL